MILVIGEGYFNISRKHTSFYEIVDWNENKLKRIFMSKISDNVLITIFTPTYNRAYILPQLYESLKNQTSNKFKWLIVDDGSTDNTEALVSEWINEQYIDIQYIKQENAGKMKAHNVGVENTETKLFVCVDSDDWIVPKTVEEILAKWQDLSKEVQGRISGFVAYKGKTDSEVIGNEFPVGLEEVRLSELYNKGFVGDTTLIFKTDIIKQYPFPIINGEKFIPEAFIYDQIDRKYKYLLIPSIMIVCEYRDDGYTSNTLKIVFNNPCGYVTYFLQKANFSGSVKGKIGCYIRANCFRHKIKNKELPVVPENEFLYNLLYPAGLLLFCSKRIKYKRLQKGD